jgi:hypothetical protein
MTMTRPSSAARPLQLQPLRLRAFAISMFVALIGVSIPARAENWPLRPYYYFVHWLAMNQPDDALAQFADDTVVTAGQLCTAHCPCVGKAEIRARYIVPLLARPRSLPIVDARFDGSLLRVYGELPSESGVHAQGWRRGGEHRFEFRDGLISAVRGAGDKTDIAATAGVEGSGACAVAFRNTTVAPFAAPASASAAALR